MNPSLRTERVVRERRTTAVATAPMIAVLLGVAACTPSTQLWSPAESPKRNVVSWAEYQHDVAFPRRSAEIAAGERQSLMQFFSRVGEGEGVRIFVAASEATDSALALRREAAIAALLRGRGIRVELGGAGPTEGAEAVRVTIGRHVVTPPNCPDWTKPASGNAGNTPSSNFGCATAANLGLMIADPGALIRGYASGPGDGTFLAKGVQDYREGKSPAPLSSGVQTGSAGGGTTGGNSSGSGN